jgi:hypothetical protein
MVNQVSPDTLTLDFVPHRRNNVASVELEAETVVYDEDSVVRQARPQLVADATRKDHALRCLRSVKATVRGGRGGSPWQ